MTLALAVVGLGRWAAQHHCRTLADHPDARIAAVVDVDDAKRHAARDLLGTGVAVYADLEDLWRHGPAVDGVVIATPTARHASAAESALRRGVAVLVEKPMSLTPDDSRRLCELATSSGTRLLVGYPYQFSPVTWWVYREIGAIGAISQISCMQSVRRGHLLDGDARAAGDLSTPAGATYLDPELGGGQCRMELVHPLASVLGALRSSPVAAVASMSRGGRPVEVAAEGIVRFASGARLTFSTYGLVPTDVPEVNVVTYTGDRGRLVHDLGAGRATVSTADGVTRSSPVCPGYPAQAPVLEFVAALSGRRPGPSSCPGDLGLGVDVVVDALYRSRSAGGGWVGIGARNPSTGVVA